MVAMSPAVIVQCFGDFSLTVNGVAVDRWRAGRARSLFQYLLVNRGRLIRRDRLYDVLWPDAAWSPGSSSLKVAVHALRAVLACGDAAGSAIVITSQNSGYLLRADDIWVDFEQFEIAVKAGADAELRDDRDATLRHHRRAAELYRDDFLLGEDADWAIELREWLRVKALRSFEVLRTEAERRNDPSGVAEWSRRILGIDPYHEDTYRALMVMHSRRGEMAEVRRWHDLCVQRLRRDLAVEPTPETSRSLAHALAVHRGGAGRGSVEVQHRRVADPGHRQQRPALARLR